jgi:hypothetical protein
MAHNPSISRLFFCIDASSMNGQAAALTDAGADLQGTAMPHKKHWRGGSCHRDDPHVQCKYILEIVLQSGNKRVVNGGGSDFKVFENVFGAKIWLFYIYATGGL